jgi:hypothetical protein
MTNQELAAELKRGIAVVNQLLQEANRRDLLVNIHQLELTEIDREHRCTLLECRVYENIDLFGG